MQDRAGSGSETPAAAAPWGALRARRGGPLVLIGLLVRVVMLVPVLATGIASLCIIVYGGLETVHLAESMYFSESPTTHDRVLLGAIEIIDVFLLATVVQVVSLGLYQLYFNQDLDLPKWLKIDSLDDLKAKLVSVIVTVLAVYFLGQAIQWTGGLDIFYLGGGAALVIVALTYFLKQIDTHEH